MVKLTVIIPVYNAEKYISRCIDSVLQQSFSDMEVLIVNDGSTDRSLEICQNYAMKDNRIKVFSQINMGVSAARNVGLEMANGEYLSMIDADDFIDSDMYKIMLDAIERNCADVVCCGMNSYNANYELNYRGYSLNRVYNKNELLEALWEKPNILGGSCANKIFKRKNIALVPFDPKLKFCEDVLFLVDNLPLMNSGVQIESCLYNVVNHSSSTTRKNKYEAAYNIILASYYIQKHTRKFPINYQAGAVDRFLDDAIRYTRIMKKNDHKIVEHCCKIAIIKTKMLKCIIYAIKNNLFNKSKIHGFIFEMIKL